MEFSKKEMETLRLEIQELSLKHSSERKIWAEKLVVMVRREEELLTDLRRELECPVCLEPAEGEIFSCPRHHLICSDCRAKIQQCPECRVKYPETRIRHRYAENNFGT